MTLFQEIENYCMSHFESERERAEFIKALPNVKCNDCYGRGWLRRGAARKKIVKPSEQCVPCKCIEKQFRKALLKDKGNKRLFEYRLEEKNIHQGLMIQ